MNQIFISSSLSSYQMAINHLHELVMDQPMHPVDKATWWMEYLIRHPNPDDAMRSPALELLWWQYLLIDVLIFLVVVVISFIIVVRFLYNFFCCRNKNLRKPKNEWKCIIFVQKIHFISICNSGRSCFLKQNEFKKLFSSYQLKKYIIK